MDQLEKLKQTELRKLTDTRLGWITVTVCCMELPLKTWNVCRSHRIHLLGSCVKQRGLQAPPSCEDRYTGYPLNNGSTTKWPLSPTKHVQPACHPTFRRSSRTMNRADHCASLIDFYCVHRALNLYPLEKLLALMLL